MSMKDYMPRDWMRHRAPRTKNPCTVCGKPGIPGLVRGQGKCQYHWNVGAFGKDWADKCKAKVAP